MPYNKKNKDDKSHKPMRLGAPGWDLYRDGLTQGSIGLFLRCREQFRLGMVDGWTARKNSSAIEFGSAFHFCLSQIQGSHTTPNKDKACATPELALRRYVRRFKSHLKLSGEEKEELNKTLFQVRIILDAYLSYWGKADKDKDWIAREETFEFRYPVKDILEFDTSDRYIPLRGRWDGLFLKSQKMRLHETKTKGQVDDDGIKAMLPFDLQTMLYCLAAKRKFNMPVDGTLYDVIRRPLLKQGKNETPREFIARVEQDISDRPKWYFHRWEVRITEKDLYNWERYELIPVLRQIALWDQEKEKGPHHFRTPQALFTTFGRCDLFNLITAGNPHGLYQRKNPYPELVD